MKEKLTIEPLRDVTLKQLRGLAAIAKSGRIRSAASALGVTPPAVSLQLKLLEDQAGLALFERSRQGLRLTDAGRLILGVHTRIEVALSEGSAACRELAGLGRGRIVVGAVSTAKYFAPRLISAFAQIYPDVDVQLTVGNRLDIIAALETLDVAIMGTAPATLIVDAKAFGPHPFVMIAPPAHHFTGRRRVMISELATERFLSRETGSGTRSSMERLFSKHDIAPTSVTEFGSNETIKQAVMAGLGIAYISAHTVAAEVGAGWLSVLRVDGLPVMREWFAVRLSGRRPSPAALAMWDFVAKSGAGFLPDVFTTHRAASASRKGGRKR